MGDQGGTTSGGGGGGGARKEIYTYEAPWQIYAMGWCQRSDPADRYRLAVGSFTEEYNNKVQVSSLLIREMCNRMLLVIMYRYSSIS